MADNSVHFDRFLGAVHRRMTLLRIAERGGVCLLGGCVASMILMSVLMYRGQEVGPAVGVTLAACAAAGVVWGVLTRPSQLAAAVAADRHLELADLLATAWCLRYPPSDPAFAATVFAQAEARCRAVSPRALALHRLGARSWGGIGVAAALVAGLYLLGPEPRPARAAALSAPRTWQEMEAARDRERGNDARGVTAPDLRRPNPGGGGDEDAADPLKSKVPDPPAPGPAATASAQPSDPTASQSGNDGSGGAAGRSHVKPASPAITDPAAGAGGMKSAPNAPTSTGGGGASSTPDARAGQGPTGVNAGSNASGVRARAPVWRAADWPADQAAARAAIASGKIPDAYRELVREYFERE